MTDGKILFALCQLAWENTQAATQKESKQMTLTIHTHRFFVKAMAGSITLARICPVSGSPLWQVSGDGVSTQVMTEEAARGWLAAKVTAAAIKAEYVPLCFDE